MHAVACFTKQRLGQEGRNLAMGDGRHFGEVLDHHHGICGLPERHQGGLNFALTWAAYLMMVILDRDADREQALGDFTA